MISLDGVSGWSDSVSFTPRNQGGDRPSPLFESFSCLYDISESTSLPDLLPRRDVSVSLGLLTAGRVSDKSAVPRPWGPPRSVFTPVGFCRSNQLRRVRLEINSHTPPHPNPLLTAGFKNPVLHIWWFTHFVRRLGRSQIWKADVVEEMLS